MKAEEHPLSQKQAEEMSASFQKIEELEKHIEWLSDQLDRRFVKIQELEETISALRKDNANLKSELKDERTSNQDINYDLHEGRGSDNELL